MGLFLFTSCETTAPCEKETNGFGPFDGQTVFLGSQETVDVFTAIDAAWAARDYETLKSFIVDGGNFPLLMVQWLLRVMILLPTLMLNIKTL